MQTSDYECFETLSEGPTWRVSEGGDSRLDREVAIKALRSDASGSVTVAPGYWDGLRALAATPREGIVGVYDIDRQRGWVVMQKAKGDLTWGDYAKPVSPARVTGLLQQLAGGLEQLHALGRVHGGVIRSNVLVDDRGRAMLNASPGFEIGGTTAPPSLEQRHVAPEFLNQEAFGEPGPAADLYCLGFLGLELLLGKRVDSLVSGVGGSGWIAWHASPASQLPDLKDRLGEVPAGLVRVLTRLTAKRPEDRYSSAREVAIDLARCEGAGASVTPGVVTSKPAALLDRLSDGATWSRIVESPTLLAKTAAALVAVCVVTTLITASALPKNGAFTIIAVGQNGDPIPGVVSFDAEDIGPTNERLEASARHYYYSVRADGFRPYNGSLTLIGGDHLKVNARMEPLPPPTLEAVVPVTLTVSSQPAEAVVTILTETGELLGEGVERLSIDGLDPGEYRLVARCDGHEPYDEAVFVYAGRGEQFRSIQLQRTEFDLTVQSNPPGATVYVDGVLAGSTADGQAVTAKVKAGTREVVLRKDGYHPLHRKIEIASQGQYLEPLLEAIPDPTVRHEVVLRSEPPGAEVFVAGKPPLQTPQRTQLEPGFHDVTVRRPGSKAIRSRIEVRGPNEVFFWRLPLSPASRQSALASADQPPAGMTPPL